MSYIFLQPERFILKMQIVTFHASSKSKVVKRYVAGYKQKNEIPKKGGSACWDNTLVPIPPLPPSDLIRCNIISLKYQLVVSYHHANRSFILDLVITCNHIIKLVYLEVIMWQN